MIYASITFPEIIPTRQEPTNATLSDSIWDCGVSQPCRINVTFDPIFTGSFLSRNYICEVITATGILTTCNPNTLYFYTGSSFLLRLTSKLDPSQSRMMSWDVRFTIPQDNSGSTSAGSQMSGSSPISTTPTTNTLTGTIETSTGTTAS